MQSINMSSATHIPPISEELSNHIANFVFSNCTRTRIEHEALVNNLLILCKTKECVTDNLKRIDDFCSLNSNQITTFYNSVRNFAKNNGVSVTYVLDKISERGLSREALKKRFLLSRKFTKVRYYLTNEKSKKPVMISVYFENSDIEIWYFKAKDDDRVVEDIIQRFEHENEDGEDYSVLQQMIYTERHYPFLKVKLNRIFESEFLFEDNRLVYQNTEIDDQTPWHFLSNTALMD